MPKQYPWEQYDYVTSSEKAKGKKSAKTLEKQTNEVLIPKLNVYLVI